MSGTERGIAFALSGTEIGLRYWDRAADAMSGTEIGPADAMSAYAMSGTEIGQHTRCPVLRSGGRRDTQEPRGGS
eukprot:2571941-Rhodomonas_salina.5